ncbi:DUF6463 family protein [Actinokineospora fastidiosa]|uniref:Uncharacterized protein n=1 Tax=Actinokineospora fastidiosa TaxID=1816 RepID=A0A918LCJ7_9PSEU|nr:DUF6463 family protein [Actinokineospora fastidiosa]GGS30227.1 hypothetical protein GCM10010171_24670 [Actinokineospora fastidiosa]
MLRWAGAIMVVLGAGHLVILTALSWDAIARWVEQGLWAAVPLAESAGSDAVAFWAGAGSFAAPMIVLGCLMWHLAGRGVAVPAWVGWGLLAWWTLGGVLLVPSPFFVGVVPSVLIVLAARRQALR